MPSLIHTVSIFGLITFIPLHTCHLAPYRSHNLGTGIVFLHPLIGTIDAFERSDAPDYRELIGGYKE